MFNKNGNTKTAEDIKRDFEAGYRGFTLLSVTQIPDENCLGVYLRHDATGLELFHLYTDCILDKGEGDESSAAPASSKKGGDPSGEENLFAFVFRTPSQDDTGVAHILEHSVLCGSERFPLKEPFTNMLNQSVNTFLNAMTYQDKTCYPAASLIKKDYYNLMDVYADACFFPLLKKEAFMQEAHRLEGYNDDECTIQGVVYNEMKGAYQSFENVASDEVAHALFADTCYKFDSGGRPSAIPKLTYEEYKAYYAKYYKSDNCLLFLYGNIPTTDQIDHLCEDFLPRLTKKFPRVEKHDVYPYVSPLITAIETQSDYKKPLFIKREAPNVGTVGGCVTVNWIVGDGRDTLSLMECEFLAEVLGGHDGSPLSKALTEAQLGREVASPYVAIHTRQNHFGVGLEGVPHRNVKKVYAVIFETLQSLCNKGINADDVEAALMHFEVMMRENNRDFGPYSLKLMERAVNAWNYGTEPASALLRNASIKVIKKAIEQSLQTDEHYVVRLIKKYLLNNDNRVYLYVKPTKNYLAKAQKAEAKLIKALTRSLDRTMLNAEQEIFHDWQAHEEGEGELACLPTLGIKDLTKRFEPIKCDYKTLETSSGTLSIFKNIERTNGLSYIELWTPCDGLPASNYKYLPLFVYCALSSGLVGLDWAKEASLVARKTGGVVCRLLTHATASTPSSKTLAKKLEKANSVGRDWVTFGLCALNSKLDEALEVFARCVNEYDFSDTQRLATLIKEWHSQVTSMLLGNCQILINTRSRVNLGHAAVVDECWKGASQLLFMSEVIKEDVQSVQRRFIAIKDALKKSGSLLHVTTDGTIEGLDKKLESFCERNAFGNLTEKRPIDEASLAAQALFSGESDLSQSEVMIMDGGVGYAGRTQPGCLFGDELNSAQMVLSHYLSGTLLWERLRTRGGAYGASAFLMDAIGGFAFYTFRDPSPFKSLEVFREVLEEVAAEGVDEDTLLRMKIGTYGEEIAPLSPVSRGLTSFLRMNYLFCDSDNDARLSGVLKVTSEDLKRTAKLLLERLDSSKDVVITSSNKDPNAFVIKLPTL